MRHSGFVFQKKKEKRFVRLCNVFFSDVCLFSARFPYLIRLHHLRHKAVQFADEWTKTSGCRKRETTSTRTHAERVGGSARPRYMGAGAIWQQMNVCSSCFKHCVHVCWLKDKCCERELCMFLFFSSILYHAHILSCFTSFMYSLFFFSSFLSAILSFLLFIYVFIWACCFDSLCHLSLKIKRGGERM